MWCSTSAVITRPIYIYIYIYIVKYIYIYYMHIYGAPYCIVGLFYMYI